MLKAYISGCFKGFDDVDGRGKNDDEKGKWKTMKDKWKGGGGKKQLEDQDSDEENTKFHDGKRSNPKVRDEDKMFVNLGLLNLSDIKNDCLMILISLFKKPPVIAILCKCS